MFCKNCGAPVNSEKTYCDKCAEELSVEMELQAKTPDSANEKWIQKFSMKDKRIFLITAVPIAILVMIMLIYPFLGVGPKSAAKKYANALAKMDIKTANSMTLYNYDKYYGYLADKADCSVKEYLKENTEYDSVKEMVTDIQENARDVMDEYNIEIKIKEVKKKYKYSKDELKAFKNENKTFFKNYKLKINKLTDVREFTVKADIESDIADTTQDFTIKLVKYNGRWYVFDDFMSFISMLG